MKSKDPRSLNPFFYKFIVCWQGDVSFSEIVLQFYPVKDGVKVDFVYVLFSLLISLLLKKKKFFLLPEGFTLNKPFYRQNERGFVVVVVFVFVFSRFFPTMKFEADITLPEVVLLNFVSTRPLTSCTSW